MNIIEILFTGVSNATSYFNLKEVNDSLSEEYAQLRMKYERLKNTDTLRPFYRFDESDSLPLYRLIPAKVVNNSVTRANNYITINRGVTDGVYPEMGVITHDGIAGIVMNASDNFATVISVLNTKIKISAKLEKSDYLGSIIWDGRSQRYVSLIDIPIHVKVKEGQKIITSGYSSFFPGNIEIGRVREYKIDPGTGFYDITVELSAEVARFKNVYVVDYLLKEEKLAVEAQAEE